jgi:hypothetical protein
MSRFGLGLGFWVLVAIALFLVVVFVVRTIWSIRLIARKPAASVEALRLHDRAAGSLGRATAIVSYLTVAIALESWRSGAGNGAAGWAVVIAAVVTVLVLILIERRWPAPGGTVRAASLQPRRPAEVLPRAGMAVTGAAVLLALGLIVVCGLTGQPSADRGATAAGTASGSGWPWPGWLTTAPLWIGMAVIGAVVALAIALLLRRPALAGFDRSVDLAYRRAGVDRLLRVLSCFGFVAASVVLSDVQTALQGSPYRLASLLEWASLALLIAGLVSVELFRAYPPMPAAPQGSAAPMAVGR